MSIKTRPGSHPRLVLPDDPGLDDLRTAHLVAAGRSAKNKGFWYIIETGDRFFVQDTCQLQRWDILHGKYCGGKIV